MSRGSRTYAWFAGVAVLASAALMAPSAAGIALAEPTPSSTVAITATAAPASSVTATTQPATSTPSPSGTTTATQSAAPRPSNKIRVPNMLYMSAKSAASVLRRAGFRVYLAPSVHSPRVKKRGVAYQTLKPGRVVKRGEKIAIGISLGPVPRPAPLQWHTAEASTYGGPGENQDVAGPYPSTGYMNAHGPYYFANKSMSFGTRVAFSYGGRTVVGVCVDRGPYVGNREFDLGQNLANALRFDLGTVRWAYAR